jgi:hypothetical protein
MAAGALAFLIYACAVAIVIRRFQVSVIGTVVLLLPLWFVSAFGFWQLWLKATN